MSSAKKLTLPNYRELWDSAVLNNDPVMRTSLDFVFISTKYHIQKFLGIQKLTTVPWDLVAALNMRECSGRFDLGLHCGQRWDQVTTLPPVGCGPFRSWEDATVDALKRKKLHLVSNWNIYKKLEMAERYNGLGYAEFHPNVLSPYVWSGTNHYSKGKYNHQGWDPNQVDKQPGVAAFFLRIKAGNLKPDL